MNLPVSTGGIPLATATELYIFVFYTDVLSDTPSVSREENTVSDDEECRSVMSPVTNGP